uniref:Uncharacterized protein n=1 Tax=Strongyloides venezuelensis TaxID=75913 RepID=A0A0K0FZ89_STRVS
MDDLSNINKTIINSLDFNGPREISSAGFSDIIHLNKNKLLVVQSESLVKTANWALYTHFLTFRLMESTMRDL